jgi:hypothetical protein
MLGIVIYNFINKNKREKNKKSLGDRVGLKEKKVKLKNVSYVADVRRFFT